MKLFILFIILLLTACKTHNTSAKDYVSSHSQTITNSTDTIDTLVENSPLKSSVNEQTNIIRKSILELSFEKIDQFYIDQIADLKKSNNIKLKERDKKISGLAKLLEKANEEIDNLKNKARENQLTILTWVSTILVIASGALIYFGQRGLAGIGVTISFLLFGVMQVIGNPLFVYCIFGLILICIIVSFVAFYKQKIKNETNVIVMSVVEDFYNKQDNKTKEWLDSTLFVELSKSMDKVHKTVVKETTLLEK